MCSLAEHDFDLEPDYYYSLLGVSITATHEEIRGAYLKLARAWHPDRHRGSDEAKRRFQNIQEAYEVLSNPEKRQQYDLALLEYLDVEDYLSRYSEFLLTPNGLGMACSQPFVHFEQQLMIAT